MDRRSWGVASFMAFYRGLRCNMSDAALPPHSVRTMASHRRRRARWRRPRGDGCAPSPGGAPNRPRPPRRPARFLDQRARRFPYGRIDCPCRGDGARHVYADGRSAGTRGVRRRPHCRISTATGRSTRCLVPGRPVAVSMATWCSTDARGALDNPLVRWTRQSTRSRPRGVADGGAASADVSVFDELRVTVLFWPHPGGAACSDRCSRARCPPKPARSRLVGFRWTEARHRRGLQLVRRRPGAGSPDRAARAAHERPLVARQLAPGPMVAPTLSFEWISPTGTIGIWYASHDGV